ncbi:MAG: flagellar motor stator protein MotA [Bacillota bacterium]
MDLFLIFGIILGALAVVVGMIVKGASVSVLLNPAAAIIILVGTTAAVMNSFPKNEFLNIPKILGALLKEKKGQDSVEIVKQFVEMSQQARKEGILSLEPEVAKIENPFLKKGLELVIDGTDRDLVRETLAIEIAGVEERHRAGAAIFSAAGSYAPTLGVLGAVIGLIGALGNLEDTEVLGHMIAAAFVATLFGIFLGYVVCHPIASRLKRKSAIEANNMQIILEGVLSLHGGENSNNLKMKLVGMLNPKDRSKLAGNSTEIQGKDK